MGQQDISGAAVLNLRTWPENLIPLKHHSLYRKIDEELSAMSPGRVLEVGCSEGRYLEVLRQRGWEVVGLELNPQAATYIIAHDLALPFPVTGPFDVVIAAEVIEHLVDTERFLTQLERVLSPNGTLILTTPNLLFGPNRLLMLFGRKPLFAYADYHVRMFVWSDLREKLERHFTIERLRGSHVLVGLHRAPRLGRLCAWLGDWLPRLSAHFIVRARSNGAPHSSHQQLGLRTDSLG